MTNITPRKYKIELSDYPYQRDIANRMLLATLTDFEIKAVEEIVNGSIKMSLGQLVTLLESDAAALLPLLKRLQEVSLISFDGKQIEVNKEARRLYSFELVKFSATFEPDLQYLQSALGRVPIHLLPNWYAIPRASDNIFQSIVEKYLQTPRIYRRYLEDLGGESASLAHFLQTLQNSPNFELSAQEVMRLMKFSYSQFHEFALTLEYQLVGSLCYRHVDGALQEYISFYHEWKQYQVFLRFQQPVPIQDCDAVSRFHPSDFGFIEDLALLLKAIAERPQVSTGELQKLLGKQLPHLSLKELSIYLDDLVAAALQLQLAESRDGTLSVQEPVMKAWIAKPKQDRASDIYCLLLNSIRHGSSWANGCTERDFREIEKSLKRCAHGSWIYFDDFIRGIAAAIGKHPQVTLVQRGKKWRYLLPEYSESEKQLIFSVLKRHCFHTCLVATGEHEGRPCFCVTPYGRLVLGD